MFVDASAIVAILTREPECDALADLLEEARSPITSPIAIFEAVLGLCRKHRASVEEVEGDIRDFIEITHLQVVSVTERESETALAAFSRYGRGQRHPAQRNMGDCFAYAMAKNHRLPLLFKGEDFQKTDIASAVHSRPISRSRTLPTAIKAAVPIFWSGQ
jgi:ribonuclease VapC